jgi:WD40 repeat protein
MATFTGNKSRASSRRLAWAASIFLLLAGLTVWLSSSALGGSRLYSYPAFVTPVPPTNEVRALADKLSLLSTLGKDSHHLCAWSGERNTLITIGQDNSLRSWEADTGSLVWASPPLPSKSGALCSPDHRWAAFQIMSNTIGIADVASGEVVTTLVAANLPSFTAGSAKPNARYSSEVTYPVAWSDDSRDLLTLTSAGETRDRPPQDFVQRWDIRSGKKSSYLVALPSRMQQDVQFAISPAGNLVATTYNFPGPTFTYTNLEVWDLPTGKFRGSLHIQGATSKIEWPSNGEMLALQQVRQVRLINATTVKLKATLPEQLPPTNTPPPNPNPPVSTQPGTGIPAPQSSTGPVSPQPVIPQPVPTVRPTDYVPTLVPAELLPAADVNEYQRITYLAWSPDSKSVATYDDNYIRFWDIGSGELRAIARHPRTVCPAFQSPSWSHDGQLFATVDCEGENRVLRLWDGMTAAPLRELVIDVHAFHWSPNETKLFVVRGNEFSPEIWGLEDGDPNP